MGPWPVHGMGMGAAALLLPSTVEVPAMTLPMPTLGNWKTLTPEGKKTVAIYALVGGVLGYAVFQKAGAVVGVLGGAVAALYRAQLAAAAAATVAAPALSTAPATTGPLLPVVSGDNTPRQLPAAPLSPDGTPLWES